MNPDLMNPDASIAQPAPASSPRRIAANRRNALKSTGPKTPAGKAIVANNARKHGLRVSRDFPCIPEECAATFDLFRQELQNVLQPNNIMQRGYFPQIVNLAWRLIRLPEAQAKIFEYEMEKVPVGTPLTAPELIARRFSDDPQNGFLLLERYERMMQRALTRLLQLFRECAGPEPYRPDEISPEAYMRQVNPFNTTEKRRREIDNALFASSDQDKIGRTKPPPSVQKPSPADSFPLAFDDNPQPSP